MTDEAVKRRKIEHVSVALEQGIAVPQHANWSDIRFVHQALPEVDAELEHAYEKADLFEKTFKRKLQLLILD